MHGYVGIDKESIACQSRVLRPKKFEMWRLRPCQIPSTATASGHAASPSIRTLLASPTRVQLHQHWQLWEWIILTSSANTTACGWGWGLLATPKRSLQYAVLEPSHQKEELALKSEIGGHKPCLAASSKVFSWLVVTLCPAFILVLVVTKALISVTQSVANLLLDDVCWFTFLCQRGKLHLLWKGPVVPRQQSPCLVSARRMGKSARTRVDLITLTFCPL